MAAVIEIKQLTKNFGAKRALQGVSLSVARGQIYGFLGPNGAGKTTTIRCLMDYIRPTTGNVRLLGHDAHQAGAELKRRIGFLSSDLQLYGGWTGHEHLDLVTGIRGGRSASLELAKELDLDLKPRAHQLSSGNKQKLAIVLAFAGQPDLLIMDEPTRGLDPLLQHKLYQLLKRFAAGGGTVFLSSHNLDEVQRMCNAVTLIRRGEVVAAGVMSDLLKMKVHYVTVTAAAPIPALKLKDVEVVEHSKTAAQFKVRGDITPLIRALAKLELSDLDVSHASLEDVFMEYYED